MGGHPPALGSAAGVMSPPPISVSAPVMQQAQGDHHLRVALNRMDIMKHDRGNLDNAHVLWLGPLLEGDNAKRLWEVCGMCQVSLLQ